MTYSLTTLRWGLEQCFNRNLASDNAPFGRVSISHWSRTSGHDEKTIQQVMDEVARDRASKVCPDVTDDEVQG